MLRGSLRSTPSREAQLHRKSGMIFAYAMLVMSLSGAVMAVGRAGAALNIPAGLVTAYLVITSLATVRPRSAGSRGWIAAPWWRRSRSARAASWSRISGGGRGAGMAFPLVMFGVVALFAGEGDRRMIRAGGLQGGVAAPEASVAHVRGALHRGGFLLSGAGQANSRAAPYPCSSPDPARGARDHGVLAVALPPQADLPRA